jgi:hypothetical protein
MIPVQRRILPAVMLTVICLSAGAVAVDTPAGTSAPGADLGRLFFTPAERNELDRIRIGISDNADPTVNNRTLRLDGVVQKNGQAPLLWVNGRRYKGTEIGGATLNPSTLNASTVAVSLPPPDPRDMKLKVGQTLDPAGGNLREVYQRPPQELNVLLQMLGKRGTVPGQAKDGKVTGANPLQKFGKDDRGRPKP